MNRTRSTFWTIVFVFIFLISVGSVTAQKVRSSGHFSPFAEDTAINPHDFTDEYYGMNGILGKAIIDRRTGSDGLSVFGKSSNPFHTDVRVIATMPASDQNGNLCFWYSLGQVDDNGFTEDRLGQETRELARLFPIYVFPHSKILDFRAFIHPRQAALMDNTWAMISGQDLNPLGVRQILFVVFTEKAYTDEGAEMVAYMAKKNGFAADDMPMLRSVDDIALMLKHRLVSLSPLPGYENRYAIAPVLNDPTNGVIARDAYLWFATKDGSPLPTEYMFAHQFNCLQKTGMWCKE